ncbi:PDZ domain-containing protein [bacterium]|nr:MAG: PDZ domain-containing protein [bacterium]
MKNDTTETHDKQQTDKQVNTILPPPTKTTTLSVTPQRQSKKRTGKYIAAVLFVAVLCFASGAGGAWIVAHDGSPAVTSRSNVGDGNQIITEQEQDIASVATKVSPSVVSILTKGEVSSYFGTQTQQGAGTGIIVSADGYILTNKHVVQDSQTVTVVTSDGTTHSNVKVVGEDPLNDVAFLKINGVSDLKAAELGDSSSLRIGQSVVAIGNALGQYKNTVTSGIVSGTGRSVTASTDGTANGATETLTDLIQTDAAINPGNSGGPLVNIAGQVIGMNTAIASDANGLGFSIPINATKGLLKGILKDGTVERAYVGVNYISITPEVAETYKLSVQSGAYVSAEGGSAVVSGSPAEKAGLKDKDIITKVNNIDVGSKGSVASLIAEYAPGDTVELTVLRDGKTITLKVTLAAYAS